MSIVFVIQIIPQVCASTLSMQYQKKLSAHLRLFQNHKILNIKYKKLIYPREINNGKISKQSKLPMGNASASQVNVRSFKVIDP